MADILDPHKVPIETAGIGAVIAEARNAFAMWVQENHPSLHDDLWGQYWLAGVAAGLSYCHKSGLPDEQRLTGLIYAAANLRRYTTTFNLPLPTNVELLYDENQSDADSPGISRDKEGEAQPTGSTNSVHRPRGGGDGCERTPDEELTGYTPGYPDWSRRHRKDSFGASNCLGADSTPSQMGSILSTWPPFANLRAYLLQSPEQSA